MIVSPSIASSDMLYVADEVAFADQHCRQVHLDVEDGVAVMGISFGMKMCRKIKEMVSADTCISLHLEVYDPLCYLDEIMEIRPNIVFIQTNHLEDPVFVLKKFQEAGVPTGLSVSDLDLATSRLEQLFSIAEQVLVLTASLTDPKQQFRQELYQYAVSLAERKTFPVWIDGGITLECYQEMERSQSPIYAAVMGRGVFGDKEAFLKAMK